jgi:hypothetical protein
MGEADPGGNAFERADNGLCLIGETVNHYTGCIRCIVDEHTHGGGLRVAKR